MTQITDNLEKTRRRIDAAARRYGRDPADITLLAVTKQRPVEAVREAFNAGQYQFGENYLDEALGKIEAIPEPACWHFIGSIQSNKTRGIAENFDWAHGVDRLKIARRLSGQRPADRPPLNVCIEVNLADEASKSGVTPAEVAPLAAQISELSGIRLRGLMALPPPESDFTRQRRPFRMLKELRDSVNAGGFELDTLSMGMTGDYEAAICEGTTIVRIGTAIFGPRTRGEAT